MGQTTPLAETPELKQLRTIVERRECVLFLGAGVSVDSGAPSGTDLGKELVETFLPPEHEDYALDEICQLVEANFGREALIERLRNRFRGLTARDPLIRIPTFRWKSIYTVNFDTLLEQAYAESEDRAQNMRVYYSDEETSLGNGEVPLYKLHGCLSRADEREGRPILTKRDYARAQQYRRNLYHRLFRDGSNLTILYVGFSRKDPDFYEVLVDIADSAGGVAALPWSYAVQPSFDEFEYNRWQQERVTLIHATALEFFDALSSEKHPETQHP